MRCSFQQIQVLFLSSAWSIGLLSRWTEAKISVSTVDFLQKLDPYSDMYIEGGINNNNNNNKDELARIHEIDAMTQQTLWEVQARIEQEDYLFRDLQGGGGGGNPECYDALIVSDRNGDRKVDSDEFVEFVQLMGPPGFLASAEEFGDLPLTLRSNFVILACLCLEDGTDPQCCNPEFAHISNQGAAADDPVIPAEQDYLYIICFLTETSINRVIADTRPSPPPSTSPSSSPTVPPSAYPSTAPSKVPTKPPTKSPTFSPSAFPSNAPSKSPSESPTKSPTDSPSKQPSPSPSVFPSSSPTSPSPSESPTSTPSKSPTAFPSASPTRPVDAQESPTTFPSASPSHTPTVSPVPTKSPTLSPSSSPSWSPTKAPVAPSTSPSLSPSFFPTVSPAPTVTSQPTIVPADAVATVTYTIAIENNANSNAYEKDLVAAMDILAPAIASELDITLRTRRRLAITVDTPTTVDGTIGTSCPSFIALEDRCEDVSASISMFLDDESPGLVTDAFEEAMTTAILNGRLQNALDTAAPNSVVYIVDSIKPPDGGDRGGGEVEPSGRLKSGGIWSLVIVGISLLFISLLFARRRRDQSNYLKQNESVELEDIEGPSSPDGGQRSNRGLAEGQTLIMSTSQTDDEPMQIRPSGQLGAVAATGTTVGSKRKSKQYSASNIYVPPGMSPSRERERGDDSSHAGSSGWSSQGGMSSLDTSSVDDEAIGGGTPKGRGLAELGAASALASSMSEDTTEPGLTMTYSELDQAIQKGDWAAVGVTAALLASQSFDSRNTSATPKSNVSLNATINPSRAAELDRLVEAGDWEGVVRAAAKFDAQETLTGGNESVASRGSITSRGSSRSPSASSIAGSMTGSTGGGNSVFSGSGTGGTSVFSGSGTGRSAFTSSAGTSTSDTNTRAKQLEDIRSEVEELVRHVVPEEGDNIDEMLLQFRGREEELVETLRSMKERAIAQKARVEGQKRAKRDAKQLMEIKQAKQQQSRQLYKAVDNTGTPADENWMNEIENTPTPGGGRLGIDQLEPPKEEDEEQEVREMQAALRNAIMQEKWDEVAEAASGLSGALGENTSMASTRSRHSDSTSRSDRSQEIDSLVDRGDWEGVVAVASRYHEADRSVGTESAEERAARRQRRLREEEEALAQADIWDAIAEQTRQEAMQSDAGAKVAADWAIARSLNALNRPSVGFGGRMFESSASESESVGAQLDTSKMDDDGNGSSAADDIEGSV